MKSRSMKIVGLLLTMLVLVATLGAFTLMASAAEQSATLSFANKAQRTQYNSSIQVWEQNGVVVTNNKGSSTSNVGDYANPARFYANSEFIVEMPGKLMTKIELNCSKNASSFVTDAQKVTGATVTSTSSKITVTFTIPVDSFTIAKLSKQVQFSSLTVTYTEASTPSDPECEHANTTVVANDDGTHKTVCSDCEAVISTEYHKNTEPVDAGNGSHKVECTVCHAVTEENHINQVTGSDSKTHSVKCTVCDFVAEEAHNSDTVCTVCGWVAPGQSFAFKITFDDLSKRTGFSTTQQVWTENGIIVTNDKDKSTTNIGDYYNPVRFYKSSKVTVAFPGMNKLVFVCAGSSYATALKNSISITNGTVTVSSSTVTVELNAPVDSFTFSCTEGQVQIKNITVSGKSPCNHEETTCTDNGNGAHDVICNCCDEVLSTEETTCVNNGDGTHNVICSGCEEVITENEAHTSALTCDKCDYVAPLTFSAWSLSLQDNLSINFAIKAELFDALYSAPSVTFTIGERTVEVTEYSTDKYEGYYTFTLTDIAPHQMGVNVGATIHATRNGASVTASTTASIKGYCMQLLADTAQTAAAKTLVVDLLNYGAASQTYVGATDSLVNADLTDAQKALGTQGDVTLNNVADANYKTVENATVTWEGAALTLIDTVEMNFVFKTASTEGLVVKITTDNGKTYTVTDFAAYGEGAYVANFNVFSACQMSEIVYVTVCDAEGNALSNTYRYSIESYAAAKQNDADTNLANLVKAMMVYGNAAKAYNG